MRISALLLSILPLHGCLGNHCKSIGCYSDEDVTLVTFPDPRRNWTSGTYVFDLVLDGVAVRCSTLVPLDGSRSCDQEEVSLLAIGVGMGASQYSYISSVRIEGLKDDVSITLSRDGEELYTEAFSTFEDSGGGDPEGLEPSDDCYQDCGTVRQAEVDWIP